MMVVFRRVSLALGLIGALGSLAGQAHANSSVGAWGPQVLLPNIAIHASTIPHTNKVWHAASKSGSPALGTHSWVYDTGTGQIQFANIPWSYDMMCGGTSLLANGKIFVTGGRINANQTALFDPATRTWEPGPRISSALYYPSNLTLGNGEVYVYFGRSNGIWEYDPDKELGDQEYLERLPPSANRTLSNSLYPKVHLLPNGKHFLAGPDAQTALFSEETESWSNAGMMQGKRFESMSVALPGDGCRILTLGGGDGPRRQSAEVIDACAATPTWRPLAATMASPRLAGNAVLLPDGTILIVGGRGQVTTEVFDPATETFTPMAPVSTVRGYHSTALLLPSGEVFVAGNASGAPAKTGETYKPTYLFKGPRPSLTVSGSNFGHGSALSVSSNQPIAKLSLIRTGTVSHGVNFEQKLIPLNPSNPVIPSNPNEAPPGWYLLYAVNAQGVPSVGQWLRIQ